MSGPARHHPILNDEGHGTTEAVRHNGSAGVIVHAGANTSEDRVVGIRDAAVPEIHLHFTGGPSRGRGGRGDVRGGDAVELGIVDVGDCTWCAVDGDFIFDQSATEGGSFNGHKLSTTGAAAGGVDGVDGGVDVDEVITSVIGIAFRSHLHGERLSTSEHARLHHAGVGAPRDDIGVQVAAFFVTNVHGEVEVSDGWISLAETAASDGHLVGSNDPLGGDVLHIWRVVQVEREGAPTPVVASCDVAHGLDLNRVLASAGEGVCQTDDTPTVALVGNGVAVNTRGRVPDVNCVGSTTLVEPFAQDRHTGPTVDRSRHRVHVRDPWGCGRNHKGCKRCNKQQFAERDHLAHSNSRRRTFF